jgi:hypothetical protein
LREGGVLALVVKKGNRETETVFANRTRHRVVDANTPMAFVRRADVAWRP